MADEVFVIVIVLISLGGTLGLAGMIIRAINRHQDRKSQLAGRDHAAVEELRVDMDTMREQVTQLEERVDFAERLLAQVREHERLGPGQ